VPGSGAPHLHQIVADPSRTGWNQLSEPLLSCLYAGPGVIVGQKRRYATRMAHNDENSPPEYGQSGTKYPGRDGAAGPLTRMTRNQAPTGRQAAEPGLTRMDLPGQPRQLLRHR
jgi:hypothetical protein